jgi:hypothetical protein
MTAEAATRQDWLHVLIKVQMMSGSAELSVMTTDKSAEGKHSQNRKRDGSYVLMRLLVCRASVLSLRERSYDNQILTSTESVHCIADFHDATGQSELSIQGGAQVSYLPLRRWFHC